MARIGVFVCWCGENIARTVDVERATREISEIPGVRRAVNYKYMCSDPGQGMIRDMIRDEKLDGLVVASCSPHMHMKTFRAAAKAAGLNPYLVEMANIREHCSWVHHDREEATAKAVDLIRMSVGKVLRNRALEPIKVPLTRRVLVIGAGVAGIQASLDIADAGFEVVLVEREPSVGGKMAGLSETFPTLDCSQCILTPRMVEVGQHPNIKLYSYSEVESVDGYVGNFKVNIRKKARYVDMDKCTGCGDCWNRCPSRKSLSSFDYNLSTRKAIYIPFPQAVPARPVIDRDACFHFLRDACGTCKRKCAAGAINFEDQDQIVTEDVGAIIVATGYQLYTISKDQPNEKLAGYGEYGYGKYKDVIDALQFERLISASGPTGGELKRPSDGETPKNVVFIQCVGSRDCAKGLSYCSKICCMYTAKHALLYRHNVHDGKAYVFYIDIRAGGKDYEEFVVRAMEDERILYLRGKVAKVFRDGDKVVVWGVDTLTGKRVEVAADLVVLAQAMVPSAGTGELARKLRIACGGEGFLKEAHPKLRPLEALTAGIFLAGAAHGPKDIPEAVAQGSGAAAKAIAILSAPVLTHSPEVAEVNEDLCSGCAICVPQCPYGAITPGDVAHVNELLCEGCGTCVAACPSGAMTMRNHTDLQVERMIRAALADAVEVAGG